MTKVEKLSRRVRKFGWKVEVMYVEAGKYWVTVLDSDGAHVKDGNGHYLLTHKRNAELAAAALLERVK